MNEDRLNSRWQRERRARKSAETFIEEKSRELYDANHRYEELIVELEDRVKKRTQDLEKASMHFRAESKHYERMEQYKGALYSAVSSLDLAETREQAYRSVLEVLCLGLNWKCGAVWLAADDVDQLVCAQTWYEPNNDKARLFAEQSKGMLFSFDQGLPGRVWQAGKPYWIKDVVKDRNFPRATYAEQAQLHGALSFPIMVKRKIYAIMEVFSHKILDADDHLLELCGSLGLQIGQFVERLEKDKLFQQSHNILRAVSEMQVEYMRTSDIKSALDKHLEVILKLTKCQYGFIGSVLNTEEGIPYLKTHTITDISWSAKTRDYYEKNKEDGLEFHNLESLFGAALVTKKVVMANNPENDSRAGGLPEGHPPLTSFIGIPLNSGDTMVGLVGLANRKGGFTDTFIDEIKVSLTSLSQVMVLFRQEKQRIASEEALSKSEEMFRLFLKNTPQATVIVNTQGEIEMVNDYALSMFGYNDNELTGKRIEKLVPVTYRESHKQYTQAFIENPESRPMGEGREFQAITKDGSLVPVEVGLSSIATSRGPRVIAVINDIREQIAIREKILMNLEEERRLGDLKSGFVSMASHEFKTPMAMILSSSSFLEMAEGSISGEDRLKKLVQIKSAVARMNGLLDNILTFSRGEKGPVTKQVQLDLAAKVRECFELENTGRGSRHKLDLLTIMPECPILADEIILNQIFSNIIGNAIKYSPAGSVVKIEIREVGQDYEVEVQDDGIGIDKSDAEFLFTPFHRGKGTDNIPGSGLGLTIVKQGVDHHGGTVRYRQHKGTGSVFTVTLRKSMDVR